MIERLNKLSNIHKTYKIEKRFRCLGPVSCTSEYCRLVITDRYLQEINLKFKRLLDLLTTMRQLSTGLSLADILFSILLFRLDASVRPVRRFVAVVKIITRFRRSKQHLLSYTTITYNHVCQLI